MRISLAPCVALILFVKKNDGYLWLCVDYQRLNERTLKNRYPLLLIQDMLMELRKAWWYTNLDVRNAYSLLRIAHGGEWKTTFQTREGLFESLVIPFRLMNASASFQSFINDIPTALLDRYVTAYLDNILIYLDTLNDHQIHVRSVLEVLLKAELHLKAEKCEFYKKEIKYLGLIMGRGKVKMVPGKVAAVQDWLVLQSTFDIWLFIEISNLHWGFIRNFSRIVHLLTILTEKSVKFKWSEECKREFETLRGAFVTALILAHFDCT